MSTLRTFGSDPLYGRATESAGGKRAESDGEYVVKLDCYAVLGISPAAEDVVIRAAYLALMRSYHPDKNPSAEAAARVRAITEAYKTIGDPARRAEYDDRRRAQQFEILGQDEEPEPQPQLWRKAPAIQWPKAPVLGTIAASTLAIALAVTALPLIQGGGVRNADEAANKSLASAEGGGAFAPNDEMRPTEPVASGPSSLAEPLVVGAPPALASEETVAELPEPTPTMASKAAPVKAEVPRRAARAGQAASRAVARPATAAKPAAADEKARLAALESQSTSFYNQSVSFADGPRRLQLQQARDMFVTSRNACRSDKCAGDAHANYIRDIAQIMQRKPTTP